MFNHHYRLSILIGTCIVIGIGYYNAYCILWYWHSPANRFHPQLKRKLFMHISAVFSLLIIWVFISLVFFYVLRSARQAKNKYCRLNSSINARKSNQKTKTTSKLCKDEWRKRHTYDSFTYIYTHIAIFLYLLTKYKNTIYLL